MIPPANALLIPEGAEWAPAWYTKPQTRGTFLDAAGEVQTRYNDATLAPMLTVFAETYLQAVRGFRANQPLRLADWQRWLCSNVLELDSFGRLRYRNYLIMIGRKNGKTFLTALIALFALLQAPNGAEIYSAANDRQQARIVFENIAQWIRQVPELANVLEITDSKNRITNKLTGAFYRALSADANAAAGYAPWLVIADEVGEWDAVHSNRRAYAFWAALTTGSADREESLVIAISTAGENVDTSLLGDLYKRGRAVVEGKSDDPRFGFACWEADLDAGDDPRSIETWKKANPNLAEGLINLEALQDDEAGAEATNLGAFYRYHLNVWSKVSGFPYMPSAFWRDSETDEDIPKGARVTLGFDGSAYRDATGIVMCDMETGIAKTWQVWERPDGAEDDWIIDRAAVETAFDRAHQDYQVVDTWADWHLWENEFKTWRRRKHWKITKNPMNAPRKRKMGAELLDGIATKRIRHRRQDTALSRHVLAAVYDTIQGFKKNGGNSSREKIDLLIALQLAAGAREFHVAQEKKRAERGLASSSNGGLIGF